MLLSAPNGGAQLYGPQRSVAGQILKATNRFAAYSYATGVIASSILVTNTQGQSKCWVNINGLAHETLCRYDKMYTPVEGEGVILARLGTDQKVPAQYYVLGAIAGPVGGSATYGNQATTPLQPYTLGATTPAGISCPSGTATTILTVDPYQFTGGASTGALLRLNWAIYTPGNGTSLNITVNSYDASQVTSTHAAFLTTGASQVLQVADGTSNSAFTLGSGDALIGVPLTVKWNSLTAGATVTVTVTPGGVGLWTAATIERIA